MSFALAIRQELRRKRGYFREQIDNSIVGRAAPSLLSPRDRQPLE
ncbi:MAG TPA: hypothetical protein VL463_32800 [Kofleriaceae bacterium]|nr:hypothetical protein [Kofleriaceae bacterium]